MFQRETIPFRKHCLAMSVAALCVGLGACSTTPRDDGFGTTVANAGRTTLEVGVSAWDRAKYLLGFSEEARAATAARAAAEGRPGPSRLLDEVDLAMLEEDAVMPRSEADGDTASSAWSDIAAASDAAATEGVEERPLEIVVPAGNVREMPLDTAEGASGTDASGAATTDLRYAIGANETLWDIAKATTGDATNWHVLADVNNLAPDAAVYPGQELTIPADMLRLELAAAVASEPMAEDTRVVDAAAVEAARADVPASAMVAETATSAVETLTDGIPSPGDDTSGAPTAPTTELPLEEGETLWDFAKRTTGDATNWQAIAEANGYSDERATKVYGGQRIAVPTELLRESLAANDDSEAIDVPTATEEVPVAAAALESESTDATTAPEATARDTVATTDPAGSLPAETPTEEPSTAIAADTESAQDIPELAEDGTGVATDDAALASADESAVEVTLPTTDDALLEETQAIRIVEAAYRAEPESAVAETAAADALPSEIMVSGTYYPKAVYNDADFSSSLLMRVPPGTTLQVSRAFGSWYEVTTAEGTGYVHARDIK